MTMRILAYATLALALSLPILPVMAAEPGEYLDRRSEIWNLFFRMMTVAFTIGTVVSGTIVWLCWRFRESHPKAKRTKYEEAGEW